MLRNQGKCRLLIKHILSLQQQRCYQQTGVLCGKSTNIFRQGKIMGKLFGHRVSGSKKRWFPPANSPDSSSPNVLFKQSQFGKPLNTGSKNTTRRMAVLNKLFMEHITDLMATGEISETILGKGLQVSRVKISQDFGYVNVFWLTSGDLEKDTLLEHELQRCTGLLRHELSQLGLMGVVPRIKFVKDKIYTNMNQVEALLRNMDFGTEDKNKDELETIGKHAAETMKQEFYGGKEMNQTENSSNKEKQENDISNSQALEKNVPEMRHDVLGLDHKGIMLKILTKMRKSKQAWEQYQQNPLPVESTNSQVNPNAMPSVSYEQLSKHNGKLAKAPASSEKFEAFLAKRKERRNTPERKKFRIADHQIDMDANDQLEYPEVLPTSQSQLFEAEDFLPEDVNNRNN